MPNKRRRARDLILTLAGVLVVAGTYAYLVLGQPIEVAESATSHASLIAMAGYVAGALMIAVGAVHALPTSSVALIPAAIACNIVAGQIVAILQLPVYLDSIGTVLVAVVAGPSAGVLTGILTNVVWGLTLSPVALPFAVVQVVIGLLGGIAARMGMFRRIPLVIVAGVVTGLAAAVIAAPVAAYLFGGAPSAGVGAIVGAFQAMGQSLLTATTLQGLLSDPLDKAVTFLLVALILRALPGRLLHRFPFARQHRVLARSKPGGARASSR